MIGICCNYEAIISAIMASGNWAVFTEYCDTVKGERRGEGRGKRTPTQSGYRVKMETLPSPPLTTCIGVTQ